MVLLKTINLNIFLKKAHQIFLIKSGCKFISIGILGALLGSKERRKLSQ